MQEIIYLNFLFCWNSAFLDIDWDNRPKCVTEEKIYTLACAEITNDRKEQVLRAMISTSQTRLLGIGLLDTSKTIPFLS